MKITFGADDLGDDLPASGSRRTIAINSIGGECVVQKEPLAGGDHPFLKPRGNISGVFVFTVTNTFADQDDANTFIAEEYARIGTQDDLVWARAATLFTFADAVLRGVSAVQLMGITVLVQYTFEILGVTVAAAP